MNDHLLSTQAKPALYFRRKIPLKDDRETFISPKSFISSHHKYDPVKLEPPIELKSVVHRVDKGTKDEELPKHLDDQHYDRREEKVSYHRKDLHDLKEHYYEDRKERYHESRNEEYRNAREHGAKSGELSTNDYHAEVKTHRDGRTVTHKPMKNEEEEWARVSDSKKLRARTYSEAHMDDFLRSNKENHKGVPKRGKLLVYNQPMSRRIILESEVIVPGFDPSYDATIDHLGYKKMKLEMSQKNKNSKEAIGAINLLKRAMGDAHILKNGVKKTMAVEQK